MISQDAIQKVLGIDGEIRLTTEKMVKNLKLTFFPNKRNVSEVVDSFAIRFRDSMQSLGVDIIEFDDAWENVPTKKRIKRFIKYVLNNVYWIIRKTLFLPESSFFMPLNTIIKLCGKRKIKKGICIVCIGEQDMDELPMQYISNFKTNSIITIVDFPPNISETSKFKEHFDAAMSLFAYHMTNIVVAVNDTKWMVYNFNASHPIYSINDGKFSSHIMDAIIPKVVAPISPHTLEEFTIMDSKFDVEEVIHQKVIEEMRNGAQLFDRTGLYPKGKKIDDLPFRHNFHKLIGKIHLDNRSGMSFGYIAFQMPTTYVSAQSLDKFRLLYADSFNGLDYYFNNKSDLYLLINVNGEQVVLQVPDVWVMTLRSGSDKTRFNTKTDLIKLGLINGEMCMQFPRGVEVNRDHKPSFDTKVILAHAVGNSMIAQLSEFFGINHEFSENIRKHGISISHWHGYFNSKMIPEGLLVYGGSNPHVSCSSPQSAIYALQGKLEAFVDKILVLKNSKYIGDVHIEPHHGINISYPKLDDLANYILTNPDVTELGNRYLE